MRRVALPVIVAALAVSCVSVQPMPDPRGALKPGQRLVVAVYPAPGPWIVTSSDSNIATAAKISPLGFLVQSASDRRTLAISKNLQQYLPRPRLSAAMQESLLQALRVVRSSDTVQTALEASVGVAQLAAWNKADDQFDWRQRYYAPDPDQPAPRDYARLLTLDDALILDVNVSFGTDASEDGHLLPNMSAAVRVYRGDTTHLIWEHEDSVSDMASTATLTDYQLQPWMLTDALSRLAPSLGTAVAASFIKAFAVSSASPALLVIASSSSVVSPQGSGLVPMSVFQNLSSTSTVPAVAPSTAASIAVIPSTSAAPSVLASTMTAPISAVPTGR